MAKHIQVRRDTPANWQAVNPVLGNGELGIEILSSGSRKIKMGDGTSKWSVLPYFIDMVNMEDLILSHAALFAAHGATATPANDRIAMYDQSGGLKSDKTPSDGNDVVRKTEIDALQMAYNALSDKIDYLLERLAQWIPDDISTESGLLILTENNQVLIEESRKTWRTMTEE